MTGGVTRDRGFAEWFELAGDAVLLVGLDGNVHLCNREARRTLRCAPGDVEGRPLSDVAPQFDARSVRALADRLPLGETFETDGQWARCDGTVFPGETRISRIRTGPSPELAVSVRDASVKQALHGALVTLADREAARIGRDLHDHLGQQLAGAGFRCRALEQRLTGRRTASARVLESVRDEVREIGEIVATAMGHVRRLAAGVGSMAISEASLARALETLAADTRRLFGVDCQAICDPAVEFPREVVAELFRIAQEATTNAVKHGEASSVVITLVQDPGGLLLEVHDDGRGFDGAVSEGGLGLRIMQLRAGLIGAALELRGAEPRGTVMSCRLSPGGAARQ